MLVLVEGAGLVLVAWPALISSSSSDQLQSSNQSSTS